MPSYLTQSLHRMRRHAPLQVATVYGERRTDWEALGERVGRLAGALRAAGVEDGDRICILAANSDRFLEIMLASFWAGGVFAPINTRWSVPEIAYGLSDSGARLLIVDRRFLPLLPSIRAAHTGALPVLLLDDTFPAGDTAADGPATLQEAMNSATSIEDRMRADDDMACLLYTGGTTGRSKGVMLSHRSIATSAASYAGHGSGAPGAIILQTAPLFHVGGLSSLFASLLAGSRQVFLPAFEPGAVLDTIAREHVTDVFLVPTMLAAVLDHPNVAKCDLSSLERVVYGASPMWEALLDRAFAAWPGVGLVQAYGMTELSPIATLLGPDDHVGESRANGRVRSAGRATMMTEVKIVDAEDREQPRGTPGEILVRGGNVMLGYWNNPAETAAVLRGGWMHTGDVGRMDDDGYVFVVDRIKDMIVSGGENVYSAEVEDALAKHPAVAQCAVIGVPHPLWGEAVHAIVVPRPGQAPALPDLVAHCRQTIATYKCPRTLELRTELPLSGAGKVLKNVLRAAARAAAEQPVTGDSS